MKKVCGEITYGSYKENGYPKNTSIHSDICPAYCNPRNVDAEYRAFIHNSLDEFLDSLEGGSSFGYFYLGRVQALYEDLKEIIEGNSPDFHEIKNT